MKRVMQTKNGVCLLSVKVVLLEVCCLSNKIHFFTLKMMPFLLWFSFTAQLVVSKWIVADYRVLLQSARNQRNHYKLFSVAPSLWLISSCKLRKPVNMWLGNTDFPLRIYAPHLQLWAIHPPNYTLVLISSLSLTPNKLTFLATTITTMLGAK